jgi:3-hydroxyacyl-[acyl-carrier-protein] dehydratase
MRRIESDFRVPTSHPALPGHFPGRPIVPGVLLLDHVIETLRQGTGARVDIVREVKFRSALQPEEEAHVLYELKGRHALFHVSVQRDREVVTVATGDFLLHASNGDPA